jgi:hypothetical protein
VVVSRVEDVADEQLNGRNLDPILLVRELLCETRNVEGRGELRPRSRMVAVNWVAMATGTGKTRTCVAKETGR